MGAVKYALVAIFVLVQSVSAKPPRPLAVSPGTATTVVGGSVELFATGGTAPYSFVVVSGTGTIRAGSTTYSKLLKVSLSTGRVDVRVRDNAGGKVYASVQVNPLLSVTPTVASIHAEETIPFHFSGGIPPYSAAVTSGEGSFAADPSDTATLVFTASKNPGDVGLRFRDQTKTKIS